MSTAVVPTSSSPAFTVVKPGLLSLLQDAGRVGYHSMGLTNGGPIDAESFYWANRLCSENVAEKKLTAIEITLGGLELGCHINTVIAVAGADIPFSINGKAKSLWRGHRVSVGDKLAFGFVANAEQGCRAYLAVAGGFDVPRSFGSSATVVREGIGGLDGEALAAGDVLSASSSPQPMQLWRLAEQHRLQCSDVLTLRVVCGYQFEQFSQQAIQDFFAGEYELSPRSDRMGFCLQGPVIDSGITNLISEGISYGAIQITTEGQLIILLNDRQTIGGYPKLGAVFSLDLARLAQRGHGANICFTPLELSQAQRLLREHQQHRATIELQPVA